MIQRLIVWGLVLIGALISCGCIYLVFLLVNHQ
jgi:hypothetical protein